MSDINRTERNENKTVIQLRKVLQETYGLSSMKTITIQQLINSATNNLHDNQIGRNKLMSQMNISNEQYSAVVYDLIKRMI